MAPFSLSVDQVSKKFCRSSRQSMYYGTCDVLRDLMGRPSTPHVLRPQEFWALEHISFSLQPGDRLGLLGRNGSGKSTLLRLLAGIYEPDAGRIVIRGQVCPLIALGAGFHPLLTGRENVYLNATLLGMTKREIDKRFDQIVEFADIGEYLDAPVKTYSSGMHVRLGFAIAIHSSPSVLLIDEVLAVGDSAFQDKCVEKVLSLNRQGTAIVFVSHSIPTMERLCVSGLFLKQGKQLFLGEIRECISHYFEDIGQENISRGCVPTRVGLGKVEISGVKVYQSGTAPEDSRIEFGEDFYIEFAYRFLQQLSHNNQVRITIKTFEGRDVQKLVLQERVFQDGQNYRNLKHLSLAESGIVKVKVLRPRLFPQSFVVDVAIVPLDRSVHLGGLANAAVFNVVHPGSGDHYVEYGNMTVTEFDYDVVHISERGDRLIRASL